MPKVPIPTREKGQRSLDLSSSYLTRIVPLWFTPDWMKGEIWRTVVRNQPIAMICRETLIANILALDWAISPRDSNQRDELKSEIEYYTKFFEDTGDIEYTNHIEWLLQDTLDLPFGSASEVGREGDVPEGRVLWIELLDGTTLFPTNNRDMPVIQKVSGFLETPLFPKHAINRMYLAPRPEMKRRGWGMAPPEKIYLTLEMLARGDKYYANLLLDTPEAGLLDLGDMDKETAYAWVKAFRELLVGVDPFKIPVLYEHTTETKFIPFGQPPTTLIFDKMTMKMSAIIAAGYGMSLSDIGLSSSTTGGDTLAGTIRQERRSRKTLFALLKKKIKSYFNRMLPPSLEFMLIDYDDELNVALGRARLANATAYKSFIDSQIINPEEARLQIMADGLMTIPMPEKKPESELKPPATPVQERPGLLGYPQPPSLGGQGEVKSKFASTATAAYENVFKKAFENQKNEANNIRIQKLLNTTIRNVYPEIQGVLNELSTTQDIALWNRWYDLVVFCKVVEIPEITKKALDGTYDEIDKSMSDDKWWELILDSAAIFAATSLLYLETIKGVSNQLLETLYINGLIASPILSPNIVFSLKNEKVVGRLKSRISDMIMELDDGTRYYFKRILVSKVKEYLTMPEMAEKIRKGIDIQDILNDNSFMQKLSQAFKDEIVALILIRINSIMSYELGMVENSAWIDELTRSGLTKKRWEHIGSDVPCDICQENISVGYVPMDYTYRSVFGDTISGPAHPTEHCVIGYDQGELFTLALGGTFHIWTGD